MNKLLLFLCCIFLLTTGSIAPAQAKWWQMFHHHHKDAQTTTQLPPVAPGAGAAPLPGAGTSYTPLPGTIPPAPGLVPYSHASSSPAAPGQSGYSGTESGGSLQSAGAAVLEPPPIPARPPIPDPPPISCPAPLGSGVPKPVLAWRAKSIRQLNIAGAALPARSANSGTAPVLVAAAGNSPVAAASVGTGTEATAAVTGTSGISKTFNAKFDDTLMAAVLALGKSGLSIQSMDSAHGKLEAFDPRLRTPVTLQINPDLLNTTNVSCSCSSTAVGSRILAATVLSNISSYLGTQTKSPSSGAAGIISAGQMK